MLGELSAQENLAESVRSYQERFFVRLYAGLFPDEAALEQPLQHMELNLASDAYLVASCEIIANTALTPAQQLKLSFSCGRMLETTLQNYLPCYVTGADAMRCNVLFCLTDAQCQKYRTVLRPLLERASQILYNYFTVRLLWAVGRPTGSLLGLARRCRENAHLQPLLTVEQPIQFVEVNEGDATAGKMQVVAQVQEYVKNHLSEKLTLADVAAVFNFSPNYLSQLFGKYGDSGFVEYITETRIAAAKEMLEQGDLKVYEIAEKLGYESAFYFPRYSKRSRGSARGNTSKVFKIGGFYDTGTACSSAGISSRLPALSPCQRAHRMAGAAPAGKAALFAGGGSRAANAHCAPAALALAGFHPHWAAHPMGDGLLFPPARLCALVSAECVEHKGRFLDEIADTVWAICEESAWQLPAHNSYVRDTPQLPLPDTTRPIVDLFAAETGALLALTRYLLPDELDTAAPGITARMERELDARILTPYFTSHFWWMGNGEEPMCNWTSWCTQNVLLTVFLLPTTQQQRKAAVKQAAYSLDCFLKDYGADGCCNEGAQYYRHAGLTLWGCLEILSNVAPEAFRPLFRETKIKNIAEYICNVHVEGPYYLNFGDCSPLAGRCGAREYRFGQAVGSDALQALAAADFRADADPDHLQNPDGSTHINLWYRLTTAFAEQELMEYAAVPQHRSAVWYPSVGIYAARQGSWVLGAKFGSNGDSHNHNDTGSITVYKDGRPFLIDIGVESYTKKTFSPQRYEIWTMQSAWHNLPTFDGVQQLPGAEYAAREVCTEENSITGELAGAYPPIPGLTTYRRSVSVSEQGITLRDETDYPGTVDLTLLTEQQPVPTADALRWAHWAASALTRTPQRLLLRRCLSPTRACAPHGRKRSIRSPCISKKC